MKRWLKRRFALSDEGVVAVIAGSIETALENIACMVPVGLLFLLVKDLLNDTVATHTFFYIAGYTSGGAPYGVTWEEMGLEAWQDLEEEQ